MGRICKVKIVHIKDVRSKSKLMQCTDTDQVLSWLIGFDKEMYSFYKFDVIDFYPSISEELVTKSLNINILTEDLMLIKNACQFILYDRGNLWRKREMKQQLSF